jgi:glycosyltransferase involved in cell wall biosynthesis
MLGFVRNLEDCYRTACVFVAPLRAGAGTRIKLLESASYGVPIVSTTIGAEGLGFLDGRDIWFADAPEAFAAAVRAALRSPDERRRRAEYARALVQERYDRDRVLEVLKAEFSRLL